MCFFIYPQCDRCRWPEINNVRSVQLCDTFKRVVHDRATRVAISGPEVSPLDLREWRCFDLYTFARASGTNYEIWMQRDCLRWGPELRPHLCKHCAEKDEWLNAAFGVDANDLAQLASGVDCQTSMADALVEQMPVPRDPVQQNTSFDPAQTDAETDIHWARLMGPSPLKMLSASVVKAGRAAAAPPDSVQ